MTLNCFFFIFPLWECWFFIPSYPSSVGLFRWDVHKAIYHCTYKELLFAKFWTSWYVSAVFVFTDSVLEDVIVMLLVTSVSISTVTYLVIFAHILLLNFLFSIWKYNLSKLQPTGTVKRWLWWPGWLNLEAPSCGRAYLWEGNFYFVEGHGRATM